MGKQCRAWGTKPSLWVKGRVESQDTSVCSKLGKPHSLSSRDEKGESHDGDRDWGSGHADWYTDSKNRNATRRVWEAQVWSRNGFMRQFMAGCHDNKQPAPPTFISQEWVREGSVLSCDTSREDRCLNFNRLSKSTPGLKILENAKLWW